jgi:hypothetical protein
MIEFHCGYTPNFKGAELLIDGKLPYYADTELGTIILDGTGVYLSVYDVNSSTLTDYKQSFPVDSNLAEFIINGLELTLFNIWVDKFKSNSKTEIVVY